MRVVSRCAPCEARSNFRLRSLPHPWKLAVMRREKFFFGLLGRAFFLHSRKRTQRTQRFLRPLSGRFLCALGVLLRPILRFRLRPRLFAAAAVVLSQSLLAQTPRLEVIHAMLQRPDDPWPRGKGHVLLAVPGCLEANKGYHEPGAGFSPSFGSFGVSIWITDNDGKIETTSDSIPLEDIRQYLVWK